MDAQNLQFTVEEEEWLEQAMYSYFMYSSNVNQE